MTSELSLPRQFGEYVLVAQLGEDGLGSVYRALASTDERRFMRLRILQSPELSPEAVEEAIGKNASRASSLLHKTIVARTRMGILDGVPFVAWYEAAGWTLNVVLAKLRANATVLPPEYALLITERVAAALEHAWFSLAEDEPFHHGLLWPGFISLSNDAEVRVGGFGLAEGILPSLSKPRLLRDVAPYLAPEVRQTHRVGLNSDVYSLGTLFLELLTGRRPTLEPLLPELRAEDPFAAQLESFLRSCFVEPSQRFVSVVQMHRALQELLAASPYALSTASLAVFLYKLLNPESSALPFTDGESTNPVPLEESAPEKADSALEATGDRRRRAVTPLLASIMHEEASSGSALAPAAEPQAGIASGSRDMQIELPEKDSGRPGLWRRQSLRRAAGLAALTAGVALAGVLLISGNRSGPSPPVSRAPVKLAIVPPRVAPEGPIAEQKTASLSRGSRVNTLARSAPRRALENRFRVEASSEPEAAARKPAEDSRLAAALARIQAERLDANQWASDLLLDAKTREQEGQRLLAERDWTGARSAFERAAALFREAENTARQERVRRVQLLPAD